MPPIPDRKSHLTAILLTAALTAFTTPTPANAQNEPNTATTTIATPAQSPNTPAPRTTITGPAQSKSSVGLRARMETDRATAAANRRAVANVNQRVILINVGIPLLIALLITAGLYREFRLWRKGVRRNPFTAE